MLSKTIFSFVFLCILLMPLSSVMAGGNAGQFGIGLTVTEESPAFLVRYWGSERITMNPEFSFSHTAITGGGYANNFTPGLRIFYHFRPGSDFRPFVGLGFALDILHVAEKNYMDIFAGPSFGAEYYFSKHFSVQGEYRVEIVATDDEFSPNWLSANASYLNTKQVLSVHFYF
jgi:hypothetical protein